MKRILIVSAIFAMAFRAYPSTMSSFGISTSVPGGTPCFLSGTDQNFGTCMSSSPSGAEAGGSVTLTDNSLEMAAYSDPHGNTFESASVTHDDFYSVPVNGPVSALLSLICGSSGVGLGFTGHFYLGSTNVSPPVESIFLGASQGAALVANRDGSRSASQSLSSYPCSQRIISLSLTPTLVGPEVRWTSVIFSSFS